MEFSFDKVANALYIWFSHEKVKQTKEISKGIIVDYGIDESRYNSWWNLIWNKISYCYCCFD